jgi:hypothetical protein
VIRETYKDRELKILMCRPHKPGHVRQIVGGRTVNHAWQGSEADALDNLKLIIDLLDEDGPISAMTEAPHWWPPATNTGDTR